MKITIWLTGALVLGFYDSTFAQGTAFTYQGQLNANGAPANGSYDFRFTVWNAASGPSLVTGTTGANAVPVSNGLFTVTLDFGPDIFTGPNRWLEINVRTNGSDSFDTLAPRHPLTATPYAITAGNVSGAVAAGALSGTYTNAVTFNNAGNSFTGNGSGLRNVNAATLDGLASSNVWKLGGNFGNPDTFLGTVDARPLTILAGNQRVLRTETITRPGGFLAPSKFAPNMLGGSPYNIISNGVLGATIAGGGMFEQFIFRSRFRTSCQRTSRRLPAD